MIDKKFDDFIKRQNWTFAKTMAKTPHWYANRNWMTDRDKKIFDEFVMYIREVGIHARYWKYNFPYLHHDGFYYWTMGCPLEETWILNRASDETNQIKDGVMYVNGVPQARVKNTNNKKDKPMKPIQDSFEF